MSKAPPKEMQQTARSPDCRAAAEEAFYQRLASTVGCEGWELDRALYWFRDDLLERAGLDR